MSKHQPERNLRLQNLADLNGHLRQKLLEFIETKSFDVKNLNGNKDQNSTGNQ